MKKMLSFLTAMLITCNVSTFRANAIDVENYYPRTAIVYSFDTVSDTVKVIDFAGEMWEFYGIEDWMIGDIVSMMMYDNNTESIYDDEIVEIRYSGAISNATYFNNQMTWNY
jgi:hypothetical protein